MAAAARQRQEPLAFLSNRQVFGDLADNELFIRAYSEALNKLHEGGARATLGSLASQP